MNRIAAILAASLLLISTMAQAQTRSTMPEAYAKTASGQVPPGNVPAFVDCLTDGFDATLWPLNQSAVRQQRRATGYRVEVGPMISVIVASGDVKDDGHAELHEILVTHKRHDDWYLKPIAPPTSAQKAFSQCLVAHSG